jgi:hypothetical protein
MIDILEDIVFPWPIWRKNALALGDEIDALSGRSRRIEEPSTKTK